MKMVVGHVSLEEAASVSDFPIAGSCARPQACATRRQSIPLPKSLAPKFLEQAGDLLPASALLLVRKYSDSIACRVGFRRATWSADDFTASIVAMMPSMLNLAQHRHAVAASVHRLSGAPRTAIATPPLTCVVGGPPSGRNQADLVLSNEVTADGVTLHTDYHQHAVDGAFVTRMLGHLVSILDQLINRPDTVVGGLQLLTDVELAELHRVNETRRPYPRDATIYGLFAEQVAAGPHRVAISHEESSLTYQQLAEQVLGVAERLHAHGVRRGSRVAYLLGKSPRLLVAALAILRVGATYVPVDPNAPLNRLNFVIADSAADLLLVEDATVSADVPVIDIGQVTGTPSGAELPTFVASAEDGACVLYTSGTTGMPKGVVINNRAVVRLVRNTNYMVFSPDTTILQTGAVAFDATTFEFWGALLNGGELVLVPNSTLLDPAKLRAAIERYHVNTLILTTALFNQTIDHDPRVLAGCCVIVGGEAASARHFAAAVAACPSSTFLNVYGPTENTVLSTTYQVTGKEVGKVPIGLPIANSTVWVLDRDGSLQPVGVTGELYVGGDGLSDGYLNRPDLNSSAFVSGCSATPERLYRTGDFARWTSDGLLDFVGRADGQVKIRGFRIELAEVESQLSRLPSVHDCVVLKRERADGMPVLCAYFTADRALDSAAVRAALLEELPEYMVPTSFQQLDAMPMNRNHKTDRAALMALELMEDEVPVTPGRTPRTPVETTVADLFAEVLGLPSVSIDDDFFALGGHSLRVMRLWSRIRLVLGVDIELSQILEDPTVAGVVSRLSKSSTPAVERPKLVRRP